METRTRILFIDDEPRVLESFRRMLRGYAGVWEMRFATGVDEALAQIGSDPVDVVVSDICMPGKSGFDLLRILSDSENTRNIPVIIVTGRSEKDSRRQALDLGATDLLSKPVDPDDLTARIRSVLRLKAYQDRINSQNADLEKQVRARTADLELSRLDIIGRLAKAGEYRDEETGDHVVRVGWYSRVLAEELEMERPFCDLILLTSPLHDIGKIGVPDGILLKKGTLTDAERSIMQRHCAIGAGILADEPSGLRSYGRLLAGGLLARESKYENPLLRMAASIALSHHERWDGAGYPRGLRSEEIPIEGRIVAAADAFDALSSSRPYKPPYAEARVFAIIRSECGTHFDPQVFSALERRRDDFRQVQATYSAPGAPEETGEKTS